MDPYEHLFRPVDRRARVVSLSAALGAHLVLALMAFLYVMPVTRVEETPPVLPFVLDSYTIPPPPRPTIEFELPGEPLLRVMVPVVGPDDHEPIVEESGRVEVVPDAEAPAISAAPSVSQPPPGGPVSLWAVQRPPEIIPGTKVPPAYPERARITRLEGRVVLEVVVLEDGTTVTQRVIQAPSPDLGFSDAAKDAVSLWRYLPATLNDRPVAVRMTVIVTFRLD